MPVRGCRGGLYPLCTPSAPPRCTFCGGRTHSRCMQKGWWRHASEGVQRGALPPLHPLCTPSAPPRCTFCGGRTRSRECAKGVVETCQ
eukprot:8768342-Pyramimonas_sp.AAC.1